LMHRRDTGGRVCVARPEYRAGPGLSPYSACSSCACTSYAMHARATASPRYAAP
jgi:hypothetical protein